MPKAWTQPICETCFHAWTLGRGESLRQPSQVTGVEPDPCFICSEPTSIYIRIDPELTEQFELAKEKE